MEALVHLKENEGAGGREKSTTLELALATPLRGVLYSDNAGDGSQSPEQLRKMIGGIVVVCTKEMAEPIAMFNIEAAGQVYSRTNEFVYLGGDINHNAHEADPFGGICGAHESYETAEVCHVWRTGAGHVLQEGSGRRVSGVFRGRSHSFRYQRRAVEERSPGRGGIAQDNGKRGGTFHDLLSCCQESQGQTTE